MSESTITKKAIAQALITLCQEKRFSKITIADITTTCGLNRQTFYYHFTDKYDLLKWTYTDTAFKCLSEETTLKNWDQHVCYMLENMQEQADFYHNTVSDEPNILADSFSAITRTLFLELFEKLDSSGKVTEEDRLFYARFFAYGCSGVLLAWIYEGFKESASSVANKLIRLARDTEFLAYHLYQEVTDEN